MTIFGETGLYFDLVAMAILKRNKFKCAGGSWQLTNYFKQQVKCIKVAFCSLACSVAIVLCFLMAGVGRNITWLVSTLRVILICVTLDLPWFTQKRITWRLCLTFKVFVILLFTHKLHSTVHRNFEVSYTCSWKIRIECSNAPNYASNFVSEISKETTNFHKELSNFRRKFDRCKISSTFVYFRLHYLWAIL